ncbi:DUF4397 domain-containing protein [candidate division KSB1 bacterium]|nr:DUF4397 domain-containing protein [candidate division KSB1 bacterium]RQW07119.1 MAG: DUF4397 domain-containing protein [candidate division KSB1 bacterium]
MKFRKFFSIIAIFSLLAVMGCSDDDNGTTPEPTSKAMVKVVHASPDAPGVDLLVDNAVAGTNLTFPKNTGYLEVDAGTRNIKVNVTGTDQTVIEANLELMKDKAYSVFAINTVANLSPLVLEDNLATPASGKAHVRFIHLSPNAPSVDITLTDGTVVFGNVEFSKYVDFTPLDAATYNLQVRVHGTDTVVLDLPGIQLMNQKIYTVFAKGLVGGNGAQALGAEIILHN